MALEWEVMAGMALPLFWGIWTRSVLGKIHKNMWIVGVRWTVRWTV